MNFFFLNKTTQVSVLVYEDSALFPCINTVYKRICLENIPDY